MAYLTIILGLKSNLFSKKFGKLTHFLSPKSLGWVHKFGKSSLNGSQCWFHGFVCVTYLAFGIYVWPVGYFNNSLDFIDWLALDLPKWIMWIPFGVTSRDNWQRPGQLLPPNWQGFNLASGAEHNTGSSPYTPWDLVFVNNGHWNKACLIAHSVCTNSLIYTQYVPKVF